jgi:hypothetical protein
MVIMTAASHALLLLVAVGAVGILHTMVPDHWGPIALLARQYGWSSVRTARTAAVAGVGHTVSTLLIAAVVWLAGAILAQRFEHFVGIASSVALIGFGLWIAAGSLREIGERHHAHAHFAHTHAHRHAEGLEHSHWHEHDEEDWHAVDGSMALKPLHYHAHETSKRTALLLILGSSPMIEGIPAFFAASRFGIALLAVMAVVFAACTVLTYVVLCLVSTRGMQRLNLGRFEEFGEVISGSFIALLGAVFLLLPVD